MPRAGVADADQQHVLARGRPAGACRRSRRPASTLAVSMVSLPPDGMASRALTTRFMSTCSTCPGSASHPAQIRGARVVQRDVLADEPAQHACPGSATTPFRSMTSGCDDLASRLKASSCWVRVGARSPAACDLGQVGGSAGHPLGRVLQHLRQPQDDGQQVVEVVRDPAGQPPDAVHALGQAELLFQAPALGDVPQRRDAQVAAADGGVLGLNLDGNPRPVGAQRHVLVRRLRTGTEVLRDRLTRLGRDELGDRSSQQNPLPAPAAALSSSG